MNDWKDTICALSTPNGVGAIGVIRMSGPDTFLVVNRLFKRKDFMDLPSHTLHFGKLRNLKGDWIDEVVVALFKGPHSYTGEDTVEISGHGSPFILNEILNACCAAGARLAEPGEFTQRAFLNGKMDLSQAEAVADLIAAESKSAQEIALNQMRGGISTELAGLRERLINFTALIELELDFGEEDVDFANRDEITALLDDLKGKIRQMIDSFTYGNAIKNGVPVAIIGKPNAGKSTLLNALLKEERAIVSEIPGTTRDVIEEAINIEGIIFRFIDTAGIRQTGDKIESMGVERAKAKVGQASVVVHLFEEPDDLLDELSDLLKDKIVFSLANKSDMREEAELEQLLEKRRERYPNYQHFAISAKSGYHLENLLQSLVEHFQNTKSGQDVIVSNIRHKTALDKALAAILEVEKGLSVNLGGDLLAIDLKEALYHLGSITGKIEVDKDILGAIFGKFCIGK